MLQYLIQGGPSGCGASCRGATRVAAGCWQLLQQGKLCGLLWQPCAERISAVGWEVHRCRAVGMHRDWCRRLTAAPECA